MRTDDTGLFERGQIRTVYGARGNALGYELELTHGGLHKHRVIKGREVGVVRAKALAQAQEWEDQWARKQDALSKTRAREQAARKTASQKAKLAADKAAEKRYVEEQKAEAARRTEEAQSAHDTLRATLEATLARNDAIDWRALKPATPFPTPRPAKPAPLPAPRPAAVPLEPAPTAVPRAPESTDAAFRPALGFLDKLLSGRRAKKEAEARERYRRARAEWETAAAEAARRDADARAAWERAKATAIATDRANHEAHQAQVARGEIEYGTRVRAWSEELSRHNETVAQQHAAVDALRARYEAHDPEAVVEYCDTVLADSEYAEWLPQEFDLDYNPETRIIVVNYALPAPEAVPTLTEVKYVASSDELTEKHLPESKVNELYDSLLYQVALRTIHELYEADQVHALHGVVFNGFVTALDKGTGSEVTACVMSVSAAREAFLAINLAKVDPKACFRQLKGVGSSKLHSIAAVPPIMTVRHEDPRFIASVDVAHTLDEGSNLATMDWGEFEHLIREMFGREFSASGGEVRVTQASRDGGVDAVAFDPDPIRGGKIVIQAKRYANTVGVSAVRDLYGTVMNEGATKGILVTTSDYGPDAYEFAQGKPLTLLNGANLLHLLERHGVRAKIDLAEAKAAAKSGGRAAPAR